MTTSCATIARWKNSTRNPRSRICAISIARKVKPEVAAAPKINTEPSYRDVDRSVLRVMEPAGLAYWAWIGFCFTLVGIAAGVWLRRIYSGLGGAGVPQPVMWGL